MVNSSFITYTGNKGHGVTHLHPAEPRSYRVHGMRYHGTAKAICGAIASGAAVIGTADVIDTAGRPCPKCIALAH